MSMKMTVESTNVPLPIMDLILLNCLWLQVNIIFFFPRFLINDLFVGSVKSSEPSIQQEANSTKRMPLKNFVIQIILVVLLLLLQ